MIPTEGMIDKYGPLIILAITAYNLLPYLVKEVMGVVSHITQSHAKVAEAPFEALKTVLEGSNARGDLVAMELMGIRAAIDRLNARMDEFVQIYGEKK